MWSDSEVALWWKKNNNSPILYVKNRVEDILKTGPHINHRHLPTLDNPADLLTRSKTYSKLVASFLVVRAGKVKLLKTSGLNKT